MDYSVLKLFVGSKIFIVNMAGVYTRPISIKKLEGPYAVCFKHWGSDSDGLFWLAYENYFIDDIKLFTGQIERLIYQDGEVVPQLNDNPETHEMKPGEEIGPIGDDEKIEMVNNPKIIPFELLHPGARLFQIKIGYQYLTSPMRYEGIRKGQAKFRYFPGDKTGKISAIKFREHHGLGEIELYTGTVFVSDTAGHVVFLDGQAVAKNDFNEDNGKTFDVEIIKGKKIPSETSEPNPMIPKEVQKLTDKIFNYGTILYDGGHIGENFYHLICKLHSETTIKKIIIPEKK